VEPLPTHRGGREPARWNAFDGHWGSSQCVLGIGLLCASSQPPKSPAQQHRYEYPWCRTQGVGLAGGHFVGQPKACAARQPSAAELGHGERLLALGDSYSSGQGAGDYEPGTDGHGNTCYRSPRAWSQRLADAMGMTALPSLACSGAVIHDVTDGRTGGEAERQISQISRISHDPSVITLTIGGNDAHFAGVLKDCVMGDCVGKYHKPSGDVLAARIAELRAALPEVYRGIHDAAPRAQLVVAGYPQLFENGRGPRPVGNCAAGKQISADEAAYLNERTVDLNQAIAGAANDAGARFVDLTDAFDGHELSCTKGSSYLNPLGLRTRLFPASFHPNDAGYAQMASVIAKALPSRRAVPLLAGRGGAQSAP
jgi:lysophospholipase L1-like esterase